MSSIAIFVQGCFVHRSTEKRHVYEHIRGHLVTVASCVVDVSQEFGFDVGQFVKRFVLHYRKQMLERFSIDRDLDCYFAVFHDVWHPIRLLSHHQFEKAIPLHFAVDRYLRFVKVPHHRNLRGGSPFIKAVTGMFANQLHDAQTGMGTT